MLLESDIQNPESIVDVRLEVDYASAYLWQTFIFKDLFTCRNLYTRLSWTPYASTADRFGIMPTSKDRIIVLNLDLVYSTRILECQLL